MSYYEDFYDEPSEFEQQIEEFKASLIKAVKEEYTSEMDRLRKENAGLQSVKLRMKDIESEHRAALHELKRKEEVAGRTALDKLLENVKVVMYTACYTRVLQLKCDKCDENRQIEYKTPSGRTAYENCECKVTTRFYSPQEIVRYEFAQHYTDRELIAWYKPIQKSDDHVCLDEFVYGDVRKVYDGTIPYDQLSRISVMFKTAEDCQKYCVWLNENKGDI